MEGKHEIVFEDLHGSPDLDNVQVDLDIDDAAKGITRVADDDREGDKRGQPNGRDAEGEDDLDRDLDEEPRRDALNSRREANEGEEEDDSGYSKNVRKRIAREVKLRLQEKENSNYWKEQAESAQRELSEHRKTGAKEVLEAIDSQISAAEKELEDAIENGKSADQVKVTSKLTDLKAKRIITEQGAQDDSPSDNRGESGRVRPSGGVNPLVNRWKSEQSDWYGKPGFERQSRMANRIDTEIYNEGYDVRTPEYFDELNKRLRKQAPELFDESDGELRGTARDRGRSPVAPVDRGGSDRPSGRSSKVQLNAGDFKNMRDFGLDPNNPTHLKEYASNKREADAQEQARREGARS